MLLDHGEDRNGSITATISIDEVLPGGEFGDITGDDASVYVIAFVTGGGDVIAEIDPTAGSLRGTIDLSNEFTSLYALDSNGTHLAAADKGAPGIPVKLIDHATGGVNDIGNYLDFVDVHIVRDQLWVVSARGTDRDRAAGNSDRSVPPRRDGHAHRRAISHGGCCVVDQDGFGINGAVIDMSTGEVVQTLDGTPSSIILAPA